MSPLQPPQFHYFDSQELVQSLLQQQRNGMIQRDGSSKITGSHGSHGSVSPATTGSQTPKHPPQAAASAKSRDGLPSTNDGGEPKVGMMTKRQLRHMVQLLLENEVFIDAIYDAYAQSLADGKTHQ